MATGTAYKIDITHSAESRFRREIMLYLHLNFSFERVDQIEANILQEIKLIAKNPKRGTRENLKEYQSKEVRFILIKESRNVELKIIYSVKEIEKSILIIDFFPTKMHPDRMLDS